MRLKIFILFFICFDNIYPITISTKTSVALDHISQGRMQNGINELIASAATNDIAAQYFLAQCYDDGIIVSKNYKEAFNLYRKVAERGLPDAMVRLSEFYEHGYFVAKNPLKRLEWNERFIKKGGKYTLPNIKEIYMQGTKYAENNIEPSTKNISPQSCKEDIPQQISYINNLYINNHYDTKNTQDRTIQNATEPDVKNIEDKIPCADIENTRMLALIIANENYEDAPDVPYALNDGNAMQTYFTKTLGIPDTHVRYIRNATLNNLKKAINWLELKCEAFNGGKDIIVYYAGHGVPDDINKEAYILPTDGLATDPSTGMYLDDFYKRLSALKANSVSVLLDACFSGAKRDGSMLMATRGISIKPKMHVPDGKIVVISATTNDQTAFPYEQQRHGLFTYYLLDAIRNSKGDITLGELADYVTDAVKHQSIDLIGTLQSPSVSFSPSIKDSWRDIKFK